MVTETWLTDPEKDTVVMNELLPSNYKMISSARLYDNKMKGGGVAILYNSEVFSCKEITTCKKYEHYDHCKAHNIAKLKKHLYPIFGFSIFLCERPTSVAPTG